MTPSPEIPPLIHVDNVSKSYGAVRALDAVSLTILPGEIHALCGENGAGKSTLIKLLGGSLRPDAGRILINNLPLPLGNVRASESAGIAVIHQEAVAFPHLSAQDNIFVGREPRRLAGLFLNRQQMLAETTALLARLGENINPHRPVGELPMAQRQMVGMARTLSHHCRLLIMDEPTASLSARETDVLFRVIRQLQKDGVSILYVSHRMEEIFLLSSRITILRDGKFMATKPTAQTSTAEIIQRMVGRELAQVETTLNAKKNNTPASAPILEVQNLTRTGAFNNISFQLHPGEIVGMAGLVGAGRSEVAQAVFGADPYDSGQILINNTPLRPRSIRAAMHAGLALVPEDRQHLGLVLPMSISANLSMSVLKSLTAATLILPWRESRLAGRLIRDLHVKTPNRWLPAQSLSGGNQQKLVLGKWLATKPRILILDEPTRGVDVGAKAEIYKLIRAIAADGIAIWIISSDLPEILLLSDRILVMSQGRIAGTLTRHEATEQNVLHLAIPQRQTPS